MIVLLVMQAFTGYRVQEVPRLHVFVWDIIMRHRGCVRNAIRLVGIAQVDRKMNAQIAIVG